MACELPKANSLFGASGREGAMLECGVGCRSCCGALRTCKEANGEGSLWGTTVMVAAIRSGAENPECESPLIGVWR